MFSIKTIPYQQVNVMHAKMFSIKTITYQQVNVMHMHMRHN